jgi:hypothetical protein
MEIIGFCIKILDSEWKNFDFQAKYWILKQTFNGPINNFHFSPILIVPNNPINTPSNSFIIEVEFRGPQQLPKLHIFDQSQAILVIVGRGGTDDHLVLLRWWVAEIVEMGGVSVGRISRD